MIPKYIILHLKKNVKLDNLLRAHTHTHGFSLLTHIERDKRETRQRDWVMMDWFKID